MFCIYPLLEAEVTNLFTENVTNFSPCTFCVLSLNDFASGGRLRNR